MERQFKEIQQRADEAEANASRIEKKVMAKMDVKVQSMRMYRMLHASYVNRLHELCVNAVPNYVCTDPN